MLKNEDMVEGQKIVNPRDGSGEISIKTLVEGAFFGNKINGFFINNLSKGSLIGIHDHRENQEVYFIISGKGKYYDNGKWIFYRKNDLLLCDVGESHGMKALEDTKFMAFIVN